MDLLSELKRLDETMTPQPWEVESERDGVAFISNSKLWQQLASVVVRLDGDPEPSAEGWANANGIARLRNLLPALIASVARERRLEESLRMAVPLLERRNSNLKSGADWCNFTSAALDAARVALEGK